ncbi:MAG: aromatic ring-opening dioxygenase subunit LigA [Alphaproteobacteria bacterium]|nr:aromatic ring-opening dioxygenase subunit LigA [Alphaproteobacteria bacterium]
MSLYGVQKLIWQLNRDPRQRARFGTERDAVLDEYELSVEERAALSKPDIGLLYVMGVNGQLLMHYAALHNIEWLDYLQRMRDGLTAHGPVRAGVYAATGYEGIAAHDARLAAERQGGGRAAGL